MLIYVVESFESDELPIYQRKPPPCKIYTKSQRELESLARSHTGHLSNITKLCNQLDKGLEDFSNFLKVRNQQTSLNVMWEQYRACCDKYADLLDTRCNTYQRVLSDHVAQRLRIEGYNQIIEQFVVGAAAFYNSQVLEEVKLTKESCAPESVKSAANCVSK